MRTTYSTCILLGTITASIIGCSRFQSSISNSTVAADQGKTGANSNPNTANGQANNIAKFTITTPGIAPNSYTTANKISILSTLEVFGVTSTTAKFVVAESKIEAVLIGPSGKEIARGKRPAGVTGWVFDLNDGNGEYKLTAQAIPSEKYPYTAPAPFEMTFIIDTEAPKVFISPVVDIQNNTGQRFLSVDVSSNEILANCPTVQLRAQGEDITASPRIEIPLIKKTASEGILLGIEHYEIPQDLEPVVVSATCTDKAGNSTTNIALAQEHPYDFALTAELAAPKAKVVKLTEIGIEEEGNPIFLIGKTDTKREMLFKLGLINKDAQILAPRLVTKHTPELKIYFMHKPNAENFTMPTSLNDLFDATSREMKPYVQLPKAFSESMSFIIPNDVYAQTNQSVIIVLTRTEEGKSEQIYSAIPFSFVFDDIGPKMEWVSAPQYIKPGEGISAKLDLKITQLTGAPLSPTGIAEISYDNNTWQALSLVNWSITGQIASMEFALPFTEEKDARIKLRIKDIVGNEFVSKLSPSFIGRTIPIREADTNCTNKSKISLTVLRGFLCQRALGTSEKVDTSSNNFYLPVALQNLGGQPLALRQGSTALGYFINQGDSIIYNATTPPLPPSTQYDRALPIFPNFSAIKLTSADTLSETSLQYLLLSGSQASATGPLQAIIDVEPKISPDSALVERQSSTIADTACYTAADAPSKLLWASNPLALSAFPCDINP